MFKQSPSRNHRSKGIKVKHVLQICVLIAVCFWLIYQVKHSRDKKRAFDENDANISLRKYGHSENSKIGRKELIPRVEEATMKNEKGIEKESEEENRGDEEEEEEEEKNKNEDEEDDSKTEEKQDEGRRGDDEIEEHDQEKSVLEVEHEEDLIDDTEKEEVDEKEDEDKEDQNENDSSLEDHDNEGGNEKAHEAREEQYRADDASSAVVHQAEAISTETESESGENSNDNTKMNVVEEDNEARDTQVHAGSQNTTDLKVEKDDQAGNGISVNTTETQDKVDENHKILSSLSENSSIVNSTMTTEANNQAEAGSNSTESSLETNNLSLQNQTETEPDAAAAQNATTRVTTSEGSLQAMALVPENKSDTATNDNQSDSSITSSNTENTVLRGELSNSSTTNSSSGVEGQSGSSTDAKNMDASQNSDKSETRIGTDGTDESFNSSETGNGEVANHDPVDSYDSSVQLEETHVRTDLDTLPEITTEASNHGDGAAE
ncbi:uncharacterized protein LOC127802657 [Diospyros lotus]|uniref:uncharacterized protein LOC127802657 n=1 Tax=Diospyros lotus TaxID=55363 RepID=UPI002252F99D|nr:uncharacterized protein LOC127802657 [Diospyros lotus]XP_052194556.1 uncharacterized protein LOC127802657 [Diospyros lotus]